MFAVQHRMLADMFSGFCATFFFLASLLQFRQRRITDTQHSHMKDRHWTELDGKIKLRNLYSESDRPREDFLSQQTPPKLPPNISIRRQGLCKGAQDGGRMC